MQEIKLLRGETTLVDDEDFSFLSKYKWRVEMRHRDDNSIKGVIRHSRYSDGAWRGIRVHRLVMGLQFEDNKIVDHIDGNPLNNQKVNLRICTNSQNLRNRSKQKNNTSGYKGVHFKKSNKRWTARIKLFGKGYHIGNFNTKEEAAKAYDKAALKYHGEFACLNFP